MSNFVKRSFKLLPPILVSSISQTHATACDVVSTYSRRQTQWQNWVTIWTILDVMRMASRGRRLLNAAGHHVGFVQDFPVGVGHGHSRNNLMATGILTGVPRHWSGCHDRRHRWCDVTCAPSRCSMLYARRSERWWPDAQPGRAGWRPWWRWSCCEIRPASYDGSSPPREAKRPSHR